MMFASFYPIWIWVVFFGLACIYDLPAIRRAKERQRIIRWNSAELAKSRRFKGYVPNYAKEPEPALLKQLSGNQKLLLQVVYYSTVAYAGYHSFSMRECQNWFGKGLIFVYSIIACCEANEWFLVVISSIYQRHEKLD